MLRTYPSGTPPAKVLNSLGQPVYVCVLFLVVEPRTPGKPFQRLQVSAMLHSPHLRGRQKPDPTCPECPAKLAVDRYAQQPHPLPSQVKQRFTYDIASGRFFRRRRAVSVREVLDEAYDCHVGTLRLAFRIRRALRVSALRLLWGATNRGLASAIGLLGFLYGIATQAHEREGWIDPSRPFTGTDFVETPEATRYSFQGFPGTPRRILWNLVLSLAAGAAFYRYRPESEFLNRVLDNETLALVCLAVAYLVSDQVGSGLLKFVTIVLSHVRAWTLNKLFNIDMHVC